MNAPVLHSGPVEHTTPRFLRNGRFKLMLRLTRCLRVLFPFIAMLFAFFLQSKGTAIRAQLAPGSRLFIDSLPLCGPAPQPYRRIRVWVPLGYDEDTAQWPVLYLLDGQNLFENASSYSGEWQVDERLSELKKAGRPVPLVVGVDNGGMDRIAEYTLFPHPKYGGGKAAEHLCFLTESVLPYVEKHYRVNKRPGLTGIGGASLGGNMALYALLEKPERFGFALLLSPVIGITEQDFDYLHNQPLPNDRMCYARMGTAEGDDDRREVVAVGEARLNRFALDFLEGYNILKRRGWPANNINWALETEGIHSEQWWSQVFPAGIRWWLENEK